MNILFDYIVLFFKEAWSMTVDMSPYLLVGMLVSGLISIYVNDNFISRHIGSKNFNSVFKATIFGIPLPLCSCGVIPVAATLRSSGASKGSTVSFLVSTPQTGVDSILLTYGMLGPAMAVFRPLAALISGLLSGLAVNIFDKETQNQPEAFNSFNKKTKLGALDKIKSALEYGFITLPSDIAIPLFQGLALATLISMFLPPDFIAENFSNMLLLPAMLLISIPLYVCATASIPIALALMSKGITLGAVFVFLMAGPATNASSITIIKKILGKKVLLQYLIMISFTSLLFGLLLDIFFKFDITNIGMNHSHEHGAYWQVFSGFLFLIVMINAYVNKKTNSMVKGESHSRESMLSIEVEGMTCNHCASSVKNAVLGSSNAKEVQVNLSSGEVSIFGEDINEDRIKASIEGLGFSVK